MLTDEFPLPLIGPGLKGHSRNSAGFQFFTLTSLTQRILERSYGAPSGGGTYLLPEVAHICVVRVCLYKALMCFGLQCWFFLFIFLSE